MVINIVLNSIDIYSRGSKYSGRTRKHVKVTHHMGAFLHYLLTSLNYEKGELQFIPSEETYKLLNEYNYLDVIHIYNHLGLNKGLFGADLVKKSRVFVLHRMIVNNRKYHKAKDVIINE